MTRSSSASASRARSQPRTTSSTRPASSLSTMTGARTTPEPGRRGADVPDNLADLVGDTPLVRLTRLAPSCGADLIAKLEAYNPAGSGEDRIGGGVIAAARGGGGSA